MSRTYWTFTLNNPTNDETVDDIEAILTPACSYACFQLEQGESGTYHYQGFIKLLTSQRISYVKKLFDRAHWEPVRAITACRNYCMKEDTRIEGPWEIGQWKKKSTARKDLPNLRKELKKRNIAELIKADLIRNNQQLKFCENLQKYKKRKITFKPKRVLWYWGETGTGKTKKAFEIIQEEYNSDYYEFDKWPWFDGYYGQQVAILDDLRAGDVPYSKLLKMLDGREIQVQIKGGHTLFNPECIIITSPYKPEQLYHGQVEHNDNIDQLLRRITHVTYFTSSDEE